jgi:hypothetical protein
MSAGVSCLGSPIERLTALYAELGVMPLNNSRKRWNG